MLDIPYFPRDGKQAQCVMSGRTQQWYVDVNRRAKAESLARSARTLGVDAELAAVMDESSWTSLARLAQVNPPSPATRELVVNLLEAPSDDHDGRDTRGTPEQGQAARRSHPGGAHLGRHMGSGDRAGRTRRDERVGSGA